MRPGRIARIEIVSGPHAGLERTFTDRLTIGRRPDNDLSLADDNVSRKHATISFDGKAWVLEDLESRLGTRVDGTTVAPTMVLTDGCQIAIGRTLLNFRFAEETSDDVQPEGEVHTTMTDRLVPLPRSDSRPGTSDLHVVSVDRELTSISLENKTETELLRTGKHLQTLLLANRIISMELDTETLLERTLDAVFNTFAVHRAMVLTLDRAGELNIRATRVRKTSKSNAQPQISRSIAYRAIEDRVGVLTLDAAEDQRFDARKSVIDLGIRSALCAPMIHQDRPVGVIYLDTVGITRTFAEEDLELLNGIAAAAAGALQNATLVQKLKGTAADTVFRLAVAAEYRDDDTGFHIHRMSDYAAALADALGYDPELCELLKLASPMHDIGKIGIPDAILKKPGKLTVAEFEVMKSHTTKGGAILSGSDSELLQMAHRVAVSHHEKFDGSGYPNALVGESIPFEGRIVAVADVFDALASRRVYKKAFGLDEARDILKQGAGKHFDPIMVDAFLGIQDEIEEIRRHYELLEEDMASRGEPPSFENLWKRSQPLA